MVLIGALVGAGRGIRRALLVTVAAVATLGLATAFASAASAPTITFLPPSPAEAATLTTDSVSLKFAYNKKPKATRRLTCTLAGPTPSSGACDAPVAAGDGSQSGKSYSGLANGSYTFTVTLTLTDGGTASATRHFTVAVPLTASPIAAGAWHTCAVTSAGAAKCWG
jgi:hypothetical protein